MKHEESTDALLAYARYIMSVVVLADLRAKDGSVTKDTVAGGYGSRFRGDSVTTRFARNVRRVFMNLPSIHVGYLAAIFSRAGL